MNTENAAPAAPEQHPELSGKYRRLLYIGGLLARDAQPGDDGFTRHHDAEQARRTAQDIERMYTQTHREHVDQVLADLHDVLKAGHTQARTETAHARMIGDAHAGDYNEGRARGYAAAITAVLEARVAVTGQPVHTRQENADAFINAIINGTGAQQP